MPDLEAELARARTALAAQSAVARVLAEAETLAEATPKLLEAIGGSLGWEVGAIWTVDPRARVLRCEATWHAGPSGHKFEAETVARTFGLGEGLPGQVWSRGSPRWVSDFSLEGLPRSPLAAREGLGGAFAFPIRDRDQILGVIELLTREVGPPDEATLSLVETFGHEIGQYVRRRQAEDAVRENEARQTAMLESALDAIITIDDRGNVVDFNPAAERIFGIPRDEALGREMAALIIPPSLRDRHRRALARAVEGGGGPLLGRRVELTGMRSDGEEFPVELTITRIPIDGPPAFTGYLREMTDRLRERERREILAEAAKTLNSSLELDVTLRALAALCVPAVADRCLVDLLGEGRSVRRMAVARSPDGPEIRTLEVDRGSGAELGRAVWDVMESEPSELLEHVPDERLADIAHDEEHLRFLRAARSRSAMLVPLRLRGRTLGALSFVVADSGRRFVEADLGLAEEIARRGALAISNARMHEERAQIAATLQASLLPPRLPDVPGLAIASRFRASGEAYEVGGDFFDLFATGRGEWTLVIGDVSGKGPTAAAVTALARYTVREATAHEEAPSAVLARLNEALLAHQREGGEHLCTALVAMLCPSAAGMRVVLSTGGHPLPLRLERDGRVAPVGQTGMLLGVVCDPDLYDAEVELGVGDSLLVYTDGVTETPIGSGILGDHGLAELLAGCVDLDAEGLLERIEQTVLELQAGEPRDDVAMIALRVAGATPATSGIVAPPPATTPSAWSRAAARTTSPAASTARRARSSTSAAATPRRRTARAAATSGTSAARATRSWGAGSTAWRPWTRPISRRYRSAAGSSRTLR